MLSEQDLQRLEKLCVELDAFTRYDHIWVAKNWEFHRSLYQHSKLSIAIDMAEQMHLKVERYVRRSDMDRVLKKA
ncbi:MAG: FCD domain-containing protein [Alphaproteobacteria bacterium]|nr:FCD domain-containing protein [Alphaproteobacteria bacterium]